MTDLNIGDTFTIAGHYRRRTFWQWITGRPKQLIRFRVTNKHSSNSVTIPDMTPVFETFEELMKRFDKAAKDL